MPPTPLDQLRRRLDQMEKAGPGRDRLSVTTPPADSHDAAQPRPGVLHELLSGDAGGGRPGWCGPCAVLAHLVRQEVGADGRLAVWIGRRVWPHPRAVEDLVERGLYVAAHSESDRLWAAELAMRSPAVGAVVLDGSGMGMSATRRLQLVARGSEALLLAARPVWEERELSAAGTRWRVTPAPSPADRPRWRIELLRCKGARPATALREWVMEWNDATAALTVPADVGDGPGDAAAGEADRRRA